MCVVSAMTLPWHTLTLVLAFPTTCVTDSNLPIVWGWEYGDQSNLAEIKERWWPLVKGEADFFACWLQLNTTDG